MKQFFYKGVILLNKCKFEVGHNYGNLDNSIDYYKENHESDIIFIKDTSGAIVSFNLDEAKSVIQRLDELIYDVMRGVQQEGR
ncbi:hypothetical protein PBN151_1414 [Paenibacillus sp. NAIST15-1]|nr:hypothetical protein PBN151_1414 [Paenibacillus sp. NAIST15-1]